MKNYTGQQDPFRVQQKTADRLILKQDIRNSKNPKILK